MIDKFQRIAQIIKFLRLPSIAVGIFSLASIFVIIFTSKSHEGDRFLIPSIVGLLWAMSTYSFIVNFHSVPEKPSKTMKFFSRLKRNINRGWYWFIGIAFLTTTMCVIIATYRVVSIWIRDYGG